MRKCEINGQGCPRVFPILGFGKQVWVYCALVLTVELIYGFCLM